MFKTIVTIIITFITSIITIWLGPQLIDKIKDTTFQSQFIYPAIVALITAIVTFLTTLWFNWRSKVNEEQTKSSDLKLRLRIEFDKLSELLTLLIRDIEDKKFYAFQNLNSPQTQNTLTRLNKIVDQVTIISNDRLREDIIKTVDISVTLIDEISLIERMAVNSSNGHEDRLASVIKEYKDFEKQLLKQNIIIEGDPLSPKLINGNTDKEKIIPIQKIIDSLNNQIRKSEESLDDDKKETDRKRGLYLSRIVSIQSRISNLTEKLIQS